MFISENLKLINSDKGVIINSYSFSDFSELFHEILNLIINRPWEFHEKNTGTNLYLKPMILKTNSCDLDLNLGDFDYSLVKMKYLVNKYIDIDQLIKFHEKLKNSSGTSLTYYFKMNKPKQGTTTDNGPCLLNIVLTRETRKNKWTRCFINYRTTEINRRFAADLILFNKIINELPSCCDLKEFYLILPKSYVNLRYLSTQINMELLENTEIEIFKKMRNEYLKMKDVNNNFSSYKSKNRIEKKLRGLTKSEKVDLSNFKIIQ